MKQLTEREYNSRMKEIHERNEIRERKRKLREERRKVWPKFKMPTTTKLLMAYIFINCTVVEIFSMVAMWHFVDLSALYSLIASVVTESVSFAVYAAKAYNETKQEELIQLERDKMDLGIIIPSPDEGIDPDPIEANEGEEGVG